MRGAAAVKAIAHALAMAGQAVFALLLVQLSVQTSAAIIGVFLAIAVFSSLWFRSRYAAVADMAYGMLTFGNLGMLIGCGRQWLSRIHDAEFAFKRCAVLQTVDVDRHADRRQCRHVFLRADFCGLGRLSIYDPTGGNLGMVVGMFAGGYAVAQINMNSTPLPSW
jgi:hypothetical protein